MLRHGGPKPAAPRAPTARPKPQCARAAVGSRTRDFWFSGRRLSRLANWSLASVRAFSLSALSFASVCFGRRFACAPFGAFGALALRPPGLVVLLLWLPRAVFGRRLSLVVPRAKLHQEGLSEAQGRPKYPAQGRASSQTPSRRTQRSTRKAKVPSSGPPGGPRESPEKAGGPILSRRGRHKN